MMLAFREGSVGDEVNYTDKPDIVPDSIPSPTSRDVELGLRTLR